MKNATRFSRLVLINSSDAPIHSEDEMDDAASDSAYRSDPETVPAVDANYRLRTTLMLFMAVSIACTTAAIASGSYAVLLSRRQAARQALTDVNDILKTCQARMRDLEMEVQQLPSRSY